MKKSLELLDDIIEIEKKTDIEYKKMARALHQDNKTVGQSPLSFHLQALRELIVREFMEIQI